MIWKQIRCPRFARCVCQVVNRTFFKKNKLKLNLRTYWNCTTDIGTEGSYVEKTKKSKLIFIDDNFQIYHQCSPHFLALVLLVLCCVELRQFILDDIILIFFKVNAFGVPSLFTKDFSYEIQSLCIDTKIQISDSAA